MVSMGEQIQVEEICSTPEMRVWNRRTGLFCWLGAEGGIHLVDLEHPRDKSPGEDGFC